MNLIEPSLKKYDKFDQISNLDMITASLLDPHSRFLMLLTESRVVELVLIESLK